MDQESAIDVFTALAQENRLAIFRLLVSEEPRGLPAGEISRRLDIVTSTLSGHLAVLKRAGLLKSTRHQREIHYAANRRAVGEIVRYLLDDCCFGKFGRCGDLLKSRQAERGLGGPVGKE